MQLSPQSTYRELTLLRKSAGRRKQRRHHLGPRQDIGILSDDQITLLITINYDCQAKCPTPECPTILNTSLGV